MQSDLITEQPSSQLKHCLVHFAGLVSPFSTHAPPAAAAGLPMPVTPDERRLSVCSNGVVARTGACAAYDAETPLSPSDVVLPRLLLMPLPQVHATLGMDVTRQPAAADCLHSSAAAQQQERSAAQEPEDIRTHLEVSTSPILEADAYTSRLDLSQQPQAATYRGIGPPLPVHATEKSQVIGHAKVS